MVNFQREPLYNKYAGMLPRRGGYSEEAGAEFKTEPRILNRNKSVTRWPVPQWLCKSWSRDRKVFDTWAGFSSSGR